MTITEGPRHQNPTEQADYYARSLELERRMGSRGERLAQAQWLSEVEALVLPGADMDAMRLLGMRHEGLTPAEAAQRLHGRRRNPVDWLSPNPLA